MKLQDFFDNYLNFIFGLITITIDDVVLFKELSHSVMHLNKDLRDLDFYLRDVE